MDSFVTNPSRRGTLRSCSGGAEQNPFQAVRLLCKARIYLAGFRGFIWRGQVPMTRVSRAASTTSTVMASSWLMLRSRATWPRNRSMSRKLPPVMRVMARAASPSAGVRGERDKPWEAPCPGAIRPQREDGRHARHHAARTPRACTDCGGGARRQSADLAAAAGPRRHDEFAGAGGPDGLDQLGFWV